MNHSQTRGLELGSQGLNSDVSMQQLGLTVSTVSVSTHLQVRSNGDHSFKSIVAYILDMLEERYHFKQLK